jgi:dolichol-phosphate mannosyltransferase
VIYILLPAYNEERALLQLLPNIISTLTPSGKPYTVCLADDGSSDETPALAKTWALQVPLQYFRHDVNRGYGAALRTGVFWAIRNGRPDDVLVMMDADNTHPPSDIPALIKKVEEGYDVVTASYTGPGAQALGVPLKRRVLSWGINGLLRAKCRLGVRTYTNGFRAYRVAALQKAYERYGNSLIQQSNFAGGTELFLKTTRTGARLAEIPFTLHYENRGPSKINISQTIRAYLKLLAD